MVQLLIDGNFILHKNVRSLHKMNRLYGDLYKSLTLNVEKYRSQHCFSRIIFVSDSKKKSWRLQESEIYKGNREQDSEIDWKFVYQTYEQWKLDMSTTYHIIHRNHIEGDDWISVLVRKGNQLGYSNVVIASDRDLQQLIKYKLQGEKSYINLQLNDLYNQEKVYLPQGWNIFLEEFDNQKNQDIFNLDDSYAWLTFLRKISSTYEIVEIDHYEKLFCKLVQGDKGDNVSSIHIRPQKKESVLYPGDDVLYNDTIVIVKEIVDDETIVILNQEEIKVNNSDLRKFRGIGDAGALKTWKFYSENFKNHFSTTEPSFLDDLLLSYQKSHKLELTSEQYKKSKQNLIQNIKLMELHHRHYPDWVLEEIANELSEIF